MQEEVFLNVSEVGNRHAFEFPLLLPIDLQGDEASVAQRFLPLNPPTLLMQYLTQIQEAFAYRCRPIYLLQHLRDGDLAVSIIAVIPDCLHQCLFQLIPKLTGVANEIKIGCPRPNEQQLIQLLCVLPIVWRKKEHLVVLAEGLQELGQLSPHDCLLLVFSGFVVDREHACRAQLVLLFL